MIAAPGGVLALDLSTRTGWAYGVKGGRPVHGVWKIGTIKELGQCGSCLMAEIEDAAALFKPSLIIAEAPLTVQAQTHESTARLQFGLAMAAEIAAFELSIKIEEERVNTVRGAVLPRQRPRGGPELKKFVVQWCRNEGYSPAEDNDADALVLWRYRTALQQFVKLP